MTYERLEVDSAGIWEEFDKLGLTGVAQARAQQRRGTAGACWRKLGSDTQSPLVAHGPLSFAACAGAGRRSRSGANCLA